MTCGRFISLEGGEGVGKSTQVERLSAALEARGIEVSVTREPGGSPGAEMIRQLLLEGEESRWNARAEALLFAAARADHVDKTIKPAIERGTWVLSDRFVDSSLAYQGEAGGLGIDKVRALHRFGSDDFLPDRTLVLFLPGQDGTDRAQARDGDKSDRIGAREGTYMENVQRGFAKIAAAEPERVKMVDASGTVEEVTERLLRELGDLLP